MIAGVGANLLQQGVTPGSILAITFTKKVRGLAVGLPSSPVRQECYISFKCKLTLVTPQLGSERSATHAAMIEFRAPQLHPHYRQLAQGNTTSAAGCNSCIPYVGRWGAGEALSRTHLGQDVPLILLSLDQVSAHDLHLQHCRRCGKPSKHVRRTAAGMHCLLQQTPLQPKAVCLQLSSVAGQSISCCILRRPTYNFLYSLYRL